MHHVAPKEGIAYFDVANELLGYNYREEIQARRYWWCVGQADAKQVVTNVGLHTGRGQTVHNMTMDGRTKDGRVQYVSNCDGLGELPALV